jgi:hypothetical protein
MLIGRVAHEFLLLFLGQFLTRRLLLCLLSLFGLIEDIGIVVTIIVGVFGLLQSVLGRAARWAPETGAFHAGAAHMQQAAEPRWDLSVLSSLCSAAWWEFSSVSTEQFIFNHELETSGPQCLKLCSV